MKHESTELSTRLGQNVRTLRERRGLTQQSLARAVSQELGTEIKSITVLRIEKGQRPTNVDELGALAAVLDVSPEQLISLDGVDLDRRDELASLLKEMMRSQVSAMAAVSNFEEMQERLKAWCRDQGSQLGSRAGLEQTTSWIDRNRIKAFLSIKYEDVGQEVDL